MSYNDKKVWFGLCASAIFSGRLVDKPTTHTVTGASSGFGRAVVEYVLEKGDAAQTQCVRRPRYQVPRGPASRFQVRRHRTARHHFRLQRVTRKVRPRRHRVQQRRLLVHRRGRGYATQ